MRRFSPALLPLVSAAALAGCGPEHEVHYSLADVADQAVLEVSRGGEDTFNLVIAWNEDPFAGPPCPTFELQATLNGQPADQMFLGGYNPPGLIATPGDSRCSTINPELRWDWDTAWSGQDLELVVWDESGEYRVTYLDWPDAPGTLAGPGRPVHPGDHVALDLTDPLWTGPVTVTLTPAGGEATDLGELQAVDGEVVFTLPELPAGEVDVLVTLDPPEVGVCEGPAECLPAWGFIFTMGVVRLETSLTVQ